MKKTVLKIITIIILVAPLYSPIYCQTNEFALKKGMTLIYNVENQNQNYDFVILLEEISPSIIFTFKMSNKTKTSGKITITQEALKNAIAQYNYFQSNEITLDKQTTVWVSKKVWTNLKKRKKSDISTNSGEMNLKKLEFIKLEDYSVIINNETKEVSSFYCITNDSNSYKYWILNNPNNALILKMELNFSIELREVRYKE